MNILLYYCSSQFFITFHEKIFLSQENAIKNECSKERNSIMVLWYLW